MKRHKTGQDFIAEVKTRQRNIVFPETVANGRRVDELFWKGSPDATVLQRVGMGLFGMAFVVMGLVLLSYLKAEGWGYIIWSWVPLVFGARLLRNAFRRRPSKTS